MAIGHARVTVDDSRDAVVTGREADSVLIKNKGSNPVFLGDVDVTDSTGYELAAGEALVVEVPGEEILYGICAAGLSTTLHTLRQ